jgi:hypothetical protein
MVTISQYFPFSRGFLYILLEKNLTFFFCENLVDFTEAHLREETLNLQMLLPIN